MGEKRDDMEQEKKLLRIERDELTRQKNQLRREEESIKTRYADFISDTAEGRTALEAAKRIEIRANDKLKDADAALKTLKHERDLLRQVCYLSMLCNSACIIALRAGYAALFSLLLQSIHYRNGLFIGAIGC